MSKSIYAPKRKPMTLGRAGIALGKYLYAIILFLFCVFPLVWIILSSLKGPDEIFTVPPSFWTPNPTLVNYTSAIEDGTLLAFTKNSVYVAVLTTVLTAFISMLYPPESHLTVEVRRASSMKVM